MSKSDKPFGYTKKLESDCDDTMFASGKSSSLGSRKTKTRMKACEHAR